MSLLILECHWNIPHISSLSSGTFGEPQMLLIISLQRNWSNISLQTRQQDNSSHPCQEIDLIYFQGDWWKNLYRFGGNLQLGEKQNAHFGDLSSKLYIKCWASYQWYQWVVWLSLPNWMDITFPISHIAHFSPVSLIGCVWSLSLEIAAPFKTSKFGQEVFVSWTWRLVMGWHILRSLKHPLKVQCHEIHYFKIWARVMYFCLNLSLYLHTCIPL